MRRLWVLVGFGMGALFVWSLTHSDRKLAAQERSIREKYRARSKETLLELAELSAISGNDYLSEDYWKEELARLEDVPDYLDEPDEDEEDEDNIQ